MLAFSRRWILLALASGLACQGQSPPSDTTAADGSQGKRVKVVVPADADAEVAPDVAALCPADAWVCLGADLAGHCNLRGDAYFEQKSCAGGTTCNPETGHCAAPWCTPGAARCDGKDRLVCQATGHAEHLEPCPGLQVCSEGTCGACSPTAPCPEGYSCEDGGCLLCTPGTAECASWATRRICDGGTAWVEEPCAADFECLDGKCTWVKCHPRVLLVVDRSGSMLGSRWTAVGESIGALATAYPEVRFGLTSFPSGASAECYASGLPAVSYDTDNAAALAAWFASTEPIGATPLAGVLGALFAEADGPYGARGGTIIVLSDGEDTCSDAQDVPLALANTTAGLVAKDVKVYVIGYAQGYSPGQLDAIAAAGGTGAVAHTAAGNEVELGEAFDGIAKDFKLCWNQ